MIFVRFNSAFRWTGNLNREPLEEISNWDIERSGQLEQPAGANPIYSVFVSLYLLIPDTNVLGQCVQAQSKHHAMLPQLFSNVRVDWMRFVHACLFDRNFDVALAFVDAMLVRFLLASS